ncbi:hypothetical protein [Mediterraneibacter sp.]
MEKKIKKYQIADARIEIEFAEDYLDHLCKDYEIQNGEADFTVSVTEEEIEAESRKSEFPSSRGILESLAVYRKLCEKMLENDCVLFHCSAVAVDGKAYLFAAKSGTGKSTHTRMWRKHFGERAVMINDDKPLLQVKENEIYVCGTPWCGKHGLQTNEKAPVQGICILRRGEENTIRKISPLDGYPDLYKQTYRPTDRKKMIKTLSLIKQLAERIPLYEMHCTISEEAAVMAWNAMKDQDEQQDDKKGK